MIENPLSLSRVTGGNHHHRRRTANRLGLRVPCLKVLLPIGIGVFYRAFADAEVIVLGLGTLDSVP